MIAPFLPLAFHFAQHSKLQHGDLLSGCGCTLILSEIIQYVIFGVNTLFQIFSLGMFRHDQSIFGMMTASRMANKKRRIVHPIDFKYHFIFAHPP